VRIKRFDMVPMFEEDAITQMVELGHAFFVFLNAENDHICVVYARRDGTYGLIEPIVGGRR
jgi:putative sigma-54 modulation protein